MGCYVLRMEVYLYSALNHLQIEYFSQRLLAILSEMLAGWPVDGGNCWSQSLCRHLRNASLRLCQTSNATAMPSRMVESATSRWGRYRLASAGSWKNACQRNLLHRKESKMTELMVVVRSGLAPSAGAVRDQIVDRDRINIPC